MRGDHHAHVLAFAGRLQFLLHDTYYFGQTEAEFSKDRLASSVVYAPRDNSANLSHNLGSIQVQWIVARSVTDNGARCGTTVNSHYDS